MQVGSIVELRRAKSTRTLSNMQPVGVGQGSTVAGQLPPLAPSRSAPVLDVLFLGKLTHTQFLFYFCWDKQHIRRQTEGERDQIRGRLIKNSFLLFWPTEVSTRRGNKKKGDEACLKSLGVCDGSDRT